MPSWILDLLGDVTLAQTILWVALVIAMLVFIRKAWPALVEFVALVNALKVLPEFIEETRRKVEEIHHEVHYNNGTSVKDAVKRVEVGVAGLYERIDDLDAADAALSQKIEQYQTPGETS